MSVQTIVNDNCIDYLKSNSQLFDLIVTSPPYNAGKNYESNLSIDLYTIFAKSWIEVITSKLAQNGQFWLNVGYTKISNLTTLPLTYLYFPLINLPLVQEIVWHYEGGMSYKKRFTHRTERWMWYARKPETMVFNLDQIRDLSLNKTNDKRNNPKGKNPTDYWYYDRVVGGTGRFNKRPATPVNFQKK